MTSLHIRKARPGEADRLTELTMRSKAVWGYSKHFLEACRNELSVTTDKMNKSTCHYLLAEEDGEIVGYYALEKQSEINFELKALFIDPSQIRKGIGRVLMDHAKDRAASLGGRVLHVQSDPNAVLFYQSMGGRMTGTSPSGSIPGRFLPTLEIALKETK